MTKRKISVSVESFMVILLMTIFAASICILIFEGSKTYETIITNKTHEENARIALSYVNMRIKQNDIKNAIYIETNESYNMNVLVINHSGEEEGLKSYIYFMDGIMWECYTTDELDTNLSTEIIPVTNITFKQSHQGSQIITTIMYNRSNQLITLTQRTTLRTHAAK